MHRSHRYSQNLSQLLLGQVPLLAVSPDILRQFCFHRFGLLSVPLHYTSPAAGTEETIRMICIFFSILSV